MKKKWAYGLLAFLMALGMALPGAMAQEKATMQVTALSEGFEGTFPPTGWGWGNCDLPPGTCTNPGTRYWDVAVVSTDIPGATAHGGAQMAWFYSDQVPAAPGFQDLGSNGLAFAVLDNAVGPQLSFWLYNYCESATDPGDPLLVGLYDNVGGAWGTFWFNRCDNASPMAGTRS